MSEDFDIYADLEQVESEARKESQELCALKMHIQELQNQVKATEQEKTDIIRKNEILLENVSSLLLTAKAEMKRKDTMISDLRRRCDNVAFGRQPHVEKTAKYVSKFTQTPPTHTLSIGVQTLPVECNDAPRSKSKKDDIVTDLIQSRDRDRERDRVSKSQIFPEREREYHGRDRDGYRDIDRYRDQERTRDRERCRDSEKERDRDRYGDRHRKRSQERNRHREHHSYARGSDKETPDVTRKKVPKHSEVRIKNEERSYGETQAPDHSRSKEENKLNMNNPKLYHDTQKCLETRNENSRSHSRTQEHKDRKKAGKLTSTDSDDVSKRVTSKNITSKMRESTREQQVTKPAISEYAPALNDTLKSSALTSSRGPEIEMVTEFRKQNALDACSSIPQQNYAGSCCEPIDIDFQKDSDALNGTSDSCITNKLAGESSTATVTQMEHPLKDSNMGDPNYVPQNPGSQAEVNGRSHQSETQYGTHSTNLLIDPSPTVSSRMEDIRLITNVENVHVSDSGAPVGDSSTRKEEEDVTNSNKEHGTFPSDEETVSGTTVNPQGIVREANIANAELSSQNECSIVVDRVNLEYQMESTKDIQPRIKVKHVQTNIINEKAKKRKKDKTPSRETLAPEPNATALQNNARKDLKQSELRQSTPPNDGSIIPTILNSENAVKLSNPTQSNTFRTAQSSGNGNDTNQTNTQDIETCSEATKTVPPAVDEIAHEAEQYLVVEHIEHNNQLPIVNDCVVTTDGSTYASQLPVSHADIVATNNKQQNASPNHNTISLNDNSTHCYVLRDRRSNSCYSDALENRTQPPLETMSIQTYFMNFNVPEAENEEIAHIERSLPANCVQPVNENESTTFNVVATDTAADTDKELQKKPKASTAEIVRERLRKRSSVQKISRHSAIPIPVNSLKRRLSIDSVSIASKKHKPHTEPSVDGSKLSVSPAGKLSSTYFSQIALPITSALDSIPSKLRSPKFTQKTHDTIMTPMVVVHSPAKPSSRDDAGQHVQNNYYSLPVDDQTSLQHIMDSLLQTPSKTEPYDNVSPPSPIAGGFHTDGSNRHKLASKNFKHMITCSTPLSTKPSSRVSQDNGPTNKLSRKSTTETKAKSTLKTLAARKEPFIPAIQCSTREGNALDKNGKGKDVHDNPSRHVRSTCILEKHSNGTTARVPTQKQTLITPASTTHASGKSNGNNNYKTLSTSKRAKNMTVVPDANIGTKNDTAILQHEGNTSNATNTLTNVPQSAVLETTVAVPNSTHVPKGTTVTSTNNNDSTTKTNEKNKLTETKGSSKSARHHKSEANVTAFQKAEKTIITRRASKCITQDEPCIRTSLKNNDSCKASSETSAAELTANNNRSSVSRKRSRNQKHEDEKRTALTTLRAAEKDKNDTNILNNHENKQPPGCTNGEVGRTEPQQLEAQSIASCHRSEGMERLNPQTQTQQSLVPANKLSTADDRAKRKDIPKTEDRSHCVVSNVTLNLSLADSSTLNNHSSRMCGAPPVQHVREMRIVKESPSLMRIFIRRK